MNHLHLRYQVALLVLVGLTVIAPTSAWAQPAPLPGGVHVCHVFSPGGPFDIPLDIIIPEGDLPIHLAHGDAYPVPPGGCRPRPTTTTSTTTTTSSAPTTTTVPSSSTTAPAETCATTPVPPTTGTTVPGVITGELPVTGTGARSLGAVAGVLLVAGLVITARSRA